MSLVVECWELLSAQKTGHIWFMWAYERSWIIMKCRFILNFMCIYIYIYLFVGSFHSCEAFSWSVEVDRCMHSLLLISSISSLRQISHSHLSSRMNGKLRRDEKRVAPSILLYTLYSCWALIRRWRWFSSALDHPYGLLFLSHCTELTWAQRMRMATIKPIR